MVRYSSINLLFCFLWIHSLLLAQDLSGLKSGQKLSVTGGLSTNLQFHNGNTAGIERSPFLYTIGANLNFSFLGISAPFSASYCNERWSYRQPFNRLALHPAWKKWRFHLGDISMSFSPYSLNGMNFRGAGIEVQDLQGWSVSAMAGRLQKHARADTITHLPALYTRMGYGIRSDYAGGNGNLGFGLFYASDDATSLPLSDSLRPQPLTNLVLEMHGTMRLWERLSLEAESAESFLKGDPALYLPNENTQSGSMTPAFYSRKMNAFRSRLSYSLLGSAIGLGLERVEPGYTTLGAYYNLSDFINYTMNFSGSYLKNKINLAISGGLQQDNLSGLKQEKNRRMVSSVSVQCTPVEKLQLGFRYSGFAAYTNLQNPFDQINNSNPAWKPDSLLFSQVNRSWGGNLAFAPTRSDRIRQQLMASLDLQETKGSGSSSLAPFINANTGWNCSFQPSGFSVSANVIYNQSDAAGQRYRMAGPQLSIRKTLMEKKLQLNGNFSWNRGWLGTRKVSGTLLTRISLALRLRQQILDMGFVWSDRQNITVQKNSHNLTLTLGWKYNFKKLNKEKTNFNGSENRSNENTR